MNGDDASPLQTQGDPLTVPVAACLAWALACLSLTIVGPRLWATQPVESASMALSVFTSGLLIGAILAWPAWSGRGGVVLVMLGVMPAFALLAGSVAMASVAESLGAGIRVALIVAALACLRRVCTARSIGMVWAALLSFAVGVPAILVTQGADDHSTLASWLTVVRRATFSHR